MNPEHIVLQTIACHGRVNMGNFEPDLLSWVDDLFERGDLMIAVDEAGSQWTILTKTGQSRLNELNTHTPPRQAFVAFG